MKKLIALLLCCGVGFLMSCQQQTTVDDVVNMMTEANGGAQILAALTDQVSTWEMTMHSVEGTPTFAVTMTAKRANKIRWDLYGPEGSIVYSSCYDGTTGWIMEMGQRKDMTESRLQEIESMAVTSFDGFLNYQDKGFTLELLADEVIDGRNHMVLQATDKHGNVQKHYINPETHFTERISGNMINDAGEWEPMVMIFEDFKMVDGIAFPQHMVQYNATGEMTWEITVKEVKHNTGVDDEYFTAEAMSEKTGLKLHSSMVIHEGQLERALKFAKESMEYLNKNFPEHNLQVYREVVGEGGKIHWFGDFKNQEDIDEYWQKASTDTVYSKILATVEGVFEEPVILLLKPYFIEETISVNTELKFQRTAVILEGQLEAALKFAKEVTEYVNKNYPGLNVQAYREDVGEGGKIHWFADYKNQQEIDEMVQKISTDAGYNEILATAEGVFEEPVVDLMLQSIY